MTRAGTFVRRNYEPLVLSLQVVIDLVVVALACMTAWALRESFLTVSPRVDLSRDLSTYREVFSITAAVSLLCFHGFGMYSPIKSLLNIEEFKGVTKASVTAFLVVLTLAFFLRGSTVQSPDSVSGIFYYLVRLHRAIDLAEDPDNYSRVVLGLAFMLILFFTMVCDRTTRITGRGVDVAERSEHATCSRSGASVRWPISCTVYDGNSG